MAKKNKSRSYTISCDCNDVKLMTVKVYGNAEAKVECTCPECTNLVKEELE